MTTCPYCGEEGVTDPIGHVPSCIPPEERAYSDFMAEQYARLSAAKMPEGMRLDIHRGTEGPAHDPYGFTEYRVRMPDGRQIMYHAGLDQWLRINGEEVEFEYDKGDPIFEVLVGFPCDQLEFWDEQRYAGVPCMACGCEGCRGGCCE